MCKQEVVKSKKRVAPKSWMTNVGAKNEQNEQALMDECFASLTYSFSTFFLGEILREKSALTNEGSKQARKEASLAPRSK